ncbi:MAG: L,D-transpeptidase [Verrucomicrobiota bacterium]
MAFPPVSRQVIPQPWAAFSLACRRLGVVPTPRVLAVSVLEQRMMLLEKMDPSHVGHGGYIRKQTFTISTSRFGVGQQSGSNQTPLGLHRIAEKIGGGWPMGTVFRSRVPVGFTWRGLAGAAIVHRILWLEGLEPGFNRGDRVDTHARYIYIHGYGDELTLGRPQSCGCIHVAAEDLLPLYERLHCGTLVWITTEPLACLA